MSKDDIIFDLTRKDWKYKGVLFGEVDNSQLDNCGMPPTPQKFAAGIMAVIWVDEEGTWHHKTRLKFLQSGNKHVFIKNYKKQKQEGVNVNETYVLQDIYKFPLIYKLWTPNPSGEASGMLEILEKLNMIESSRIVTN